MYALFDDPSGYNWGPGEHFESLAEAMSGAGHADPTHWHANPDDPNRLDLKLKHQFHAGWGFVQWNIVAPNVTAEHVQLVAAAPTA